jgi:hypothetical protein
MSKYYWKMDENERFHVYDPQGNRIATIDNDGDKSIGEIDAEDLVAHLNEPLPSSEDAEYKASQVGFGMGIVIGGEDFAEGEEDELRLPVEITAPTGVPIASITSMDDAVALLKHFSR